MSEKPEGICILEGMTGEEHGEASERAYYPKIVEMAERVVATGFEPRMFTAGIPVDDPANPDARALETARRIRALGCHVSFKTRGRRTIIVGCAAKR